MGHTHQYYSAAQAAADLPTSKRIELVSLLLATLDAADQTTAINNAATVDLAVQPRPILTAIARGNR